LSSATLPKDEVEESLSLRVSPQVKLHNRKVEIFM